MIENVTVLGGATARRHVDAPVAVAEFGNEVLDGLPPVDLDRLRPHLRRVPLVQGQVLYEPEDILDRVYFPQSGLISLVTPLRNGGDVETISRGRDGAVGYEEACGSGVIASRVVVQIAGAGWRLGAGRLRTVQQTSSHLQAELYRRTEFLLAEARQSIACRATHLAPERLARLLLETADHTGTERYLLTQESIAAMIGVGRTTVTSAASGLKRRRIIRYTRGTVTIMNRDALHAAGCECYGVIRGVRRRLLRAPIACDTAPPALA